MGFSGLKIQLEASAWLSYVHNTIGEKFRSLQCVQLENTARQLQRVHRSLQNTLVIRTMLSRSTGCVVTSTEDLQRTASSCAASLGTDDLM